MLIREISVKIIKISEWFDFIFVNALNLSDLSELVLDEWRVSFFFFFINKRLFWKVLYSATTFSQIQAFYIQRSPRVTIKHVILLPIVKHLKCTGILKTENSGCTFLPKTIELKFYYTSIFVTCNKTYFLSVWKHFLTSVMNNSMFLNIFSFISERNNDCSDTLTRLQKGGGR